MLSAIGVFGCILSTMLRRLRLLGTLSSTVLALVPGCFNPDDAPADTDAGSSSSTEASTESVGTSNPGSSESGVDEGSTSSDDTTGDPGTTTLDPTTSSTGDPDASSSTGDEPVDPACDDGVVVATEVCFEINNTLDGQNYRYGFLEDLDGDGERDLIYSAVSGEISVQLNADGVFGLATMSTFNGVTSLSDLGFMHIDDDDVLDTFMVSVAGAVVYTAFGNSSGDFVLGDGQGSEAFALDMGDLDGDDREEAVVLSLDGVEVFGIDTAGVITVVDNVTPSNFGGYVAVQLADFNGDDQRDVLLLGTNFMEGPEVLLYLGNGNGTLNGAALTGLVEIDDPTDLVAGDFDGDGATDFVLADGSTLLVVMGNDALGFTQLDDITVDSGTASVLEVVDVDLDGNDDIIVGFSDRNVLAVYLADGAGGFAAPVDVSIPHPVEHISTGDANGDQVPDIVVSSNAADSLTVLFSRN